MSLKSLRDLIRSLTQGNVGKPTSRSETAQKAGVPAAPDAKAPDNKTLEEIRDLFKDYKKDWEKDAAEAKKHVEESVAALKALEKAKADAKGKGKPVEAAKNGKPRVSKEDSITAKSLASLEKHATKKGSLYTHDIHTNATLKELKRIIFKMDPSAHVAEGSDPGKFRVDTNLDRGKIKKGIEDGGKMARVNEVPKSSKGSKSEWTMKLNNLKYELFEVESQIEKIEKALFGLNIGTEVFKGIITEETKFIRDSRALAYEIDGVTKETRALQRAYEDIGKTAETTGMGRSEYQKEYLKNLKKGIRDLNTVNKVTTAQLNTERMIGVEAGTLGDTFGEWNTAMRMNSGQVAEMGRGIRDVAKFTGITGEALASAVKTSGDFIKGLRNAATLTAAAAKNIIEIQATAQKLGTADTLNPLMKAMTNTNNLIREASNQTRALLINAADKVGRVGELMNGTILKSKAGIKDMAKGLEGNLRMFGVNSLEEIDNLSDEAKMRLNLQLKAAFGIELGEMRQTIETLREAGKGLGDRIEDINKKLKENVTVEERAALMEQKRALAASASLSVLNALDESAKGAQDMSQALAKFGQRRKEFEGDLNAMGITATDNADVARQAIGSALENINKSLKAGGKQELKIDSSQIEKALQDPVAFRELQSTLTKAEQQAAVAAKTQLDPISQINQKVSEINDSIRNLSQNVISKLLNSVLGKLGLIVIAIASVASTVALFVASMVLLRSQMKDLFTNLGGSVKGLLGFGPKAGPGDGGMPDIPDIGGDKIPGKKSKDKAEKAAEKAAKGKCDPCTHLMEIVGLLKRIAECVCNAPKPNAIQPSPNATQPPTMAQMTPPKATSNLEDPREVKAKLKAINDDKKLSAADKKLQMREVVMQRKDIVLQKKDIVSVKKGDKIQDAQSGLVKNQQKNAKAAPAAASPAPPTPPGGGWDLASLKAAGPEMAKTAAAILIMAVGVVALGAAIVFLSHKVIKAFDLSLGKVIETAAVIAAIAVAGGAIALAAYGVIEGLQSKEAQDFVKKAKLGYGQLLKTAAAILIIGPAVVALGAAIVAFAGWVLKAFKLDISTVLETAAVVAAVAGAASAIIVAASEALEAMDGMNKIPGAKKLMKNPGKMALMMLKGAAALIILGPAIVLLGAVIVKFAQWILGSFGLTSKVAMEVGLTTAAVLISAALIAGAIAGALYGLAGLGILAAKAVAAWKLIGAGALALVILTPVILILAGAILKMAQVILGAFGLTSKEAIEIGLTVAAVILGAAAIAGAVIGALYGLMQLGMLVPIAYAKAPLIWLGAKALFLLTPAVLILAMAILKMSQAIMSAGGMDMKKAVDTAKNVAAIILGAGVIAGGVIGAMYGLYGLGLLAKMAWKVYGTILLGALALLILTPVMLTLASTIIKMGDSMVDMPPKVVEDIVNKVVALFKGAAQIAGAVLLSLGALAILGSAMTGGAFWIALALAAAGAIAISLLTPVMMRFAHSILEMGKQFTQTVSVEEAKKTAEGVKSIFDSAAEISSAVLSAMGNLIKLGFLSLLNMFGMLVGLMNVGANFFFKIAQPIGRFAMSLLAMGKSMTTAMPMEEAKKIAEGVKVIFESAGVVSGQIGDMAWSLMKMGFLSIINIRGWIVSLMESGAKFFFEMARPIGAFAMSLLKMGEAMTNMIAPAKAKEIASGIKDIFEAAGTVQDTLQSQMKTLMKIGMLSWFSWLLPDLDKAAQFFIDMAKPAMKFTLTLIALGRMLVSAAGGPKKIKPLIEGIKGIAEIVDAVGLVMDTLIKKIVPLTRAKWFGLFGNSKLEDLADAVPKFSESFKSITSFIRDGIILPIKATFKNTQQITKIIAIAKGMADIITAVGTIMDTIVKVVLPLTRAKWFGLWGNSKLQDLNEAIGPFQETFATVVAFIRDGIIVPIKNTFRNVKKVVEVTKIAKAIGEAMAAVVPMMDAISKVVVGMTTAPSFLWFTTGKSTVEKLKEGIAKLDGVFTEIVNFVKNGVIAPITRAFPNLKKAQAIVPLAKAIGESVAAIATVMDILANKLAPMAEPEQAEWYQFWKSDKPDKITQLKTFIEKFRQPFIALVDFLKNGLIGPVTQAFPNLKAVQGILPIVKGVGEAVAAIATVMDVLANKLAPMADAESAEWYKFWKSDGPSKFDKLLTVIPQIGRVWTSLVMFVRDGLIWPVMNAFPDLAKAESQVKVVKMVADAVKTVAEVLETMNEIAATIDPMSGLKAIFGRMDKTVSPLEAAIPTIQSTFLAMTNFIQEGVIKPVAGLNLKGLTTTVQKLLVMQKAFSVMGEMIEALQGMVGLTQGSSTTTTSGMLWWKKSVTTTIAPMTDQMTTAIPEIEKVFKGIVAFVQNGIIKPVEGLGDIKTLKTSAKKLILAAKMLELVPHMIEGLNEAMTELLVFTKSKFSSTTISTDEIANRYKGWFEWIAYFVREGIVTPVQGIGEIGKLKSAAKIIMWSAMILQNLPKVLEGLNDSFDALLDFTNSKFTGDGLKNGDIAGRYKAWFVWIAGFITDAIVGPVNKLGSAKELKKTAKIIEMAAIIMTNFPKVVTGLNDAMSGISAVSWRFSADQGESNKIAENYRAWFEWITTFSRQLIGYIAKIGEVEQLRTTAKIMCAAATILTNFPKVVMGLNDAMNAVNALAAGKFLTTQEDNTAIAERYRGWFNWVTYFVRTAIIEPAKGMGDVGQLVTVGKMMCAAAKILFSMPIIIRGVGASMDGINALASEHFLQTEAQNTGIANNFKAWFIWVGQFVKTAIVEPMNKTFDDIKALTNAARIMRAVQVILQALPKVITGLAQAFRLVVDDNSMADTPGEKITAHKEEFKTWFGAVAEFMNKGIVQPILTKLPNVKDIIVAAQLMRAMAIVIQSIPKVILGIANGLIPLIDSGMTLKDTPADKIADSKDDFKTWFETIAEFMNKGIVQPILLKLPNVKDIMMAARLIRAMSIVITGVVSVIRNISKVFGTLQPDQCLNASPMGMIVAAIPIYKSWWGSVIDFLVKGIIDPILEGFPTKDEIGFIVEAMKNMIQTVRLLPGFLMELGVALSPMVSGDWMRASPMSTVANAAIIFGMYFKAISDALVKGMIEPIKLWPQSTDLDEVVAQLNGMSNAVSGVAGVLATFSEKLGPLVNGFWWYSPELSDLSRKTDRFAGYFNGIASAMKRGIIDPIKNNFPASSELNEVVAQVKAIDEVISSLSSAMTNLAKTIAELNTLEMPDLNPEVLGKMAGILQELSVPRGLAPPEMVSFNEADLAPPSNSIKEMGIEANAAATGGASAGGELDPSKANIEHKLQKKASDAQKGSAKSLDMITTEASKPSGLTVGDTTMHGLMGQLISYFNGGADMTTPTKTSNINGNLEPATSGEDLLNSDNSFSQFLAKSFGLSMPTPPTMRNVGGIQTSGNSNDEQAQRPRAIPPASANLDMQRRVQQERVTSQPSATNVSSPELAQIAASSQETKQATTQMVALLQALVNYMKPQASQVGGSEGGGAGSGGTNVQVSSPPKYYKWNTGKHNQTAGKGVTNVGSTSY